MIDLIKFEQNLNANTDLLEIARDYCEFNQDKDSSTNTLITLLDIILANHKRLILDIDECSAI